MSRGRPAFGKITLHTCIGLHTYVVYVGEKGDREFRISDQVKNSDGNCGEFRWSPEEGPVSQIHSPHLHVGAPGIFSDLLRSVQMLKREGRGKQREVTALIQSLAKLQPWFLSLRWKTCLQQSSSLGSCACSEVLPLGRTVWEGWYVYVIIWQETKFELHSDWFLMEVW